jgi:hypothetical protein
MDFDSLDFKKKILVAVQLTEAWLHVGAGDADNLSKKDIEVAI